MSTTALEPSEIPADFVVRPIDPNDPTATDPATCGTCGLTWDDGIPTSWTPAPSGRCPFEYFHVDPDDNDGGTDTQRAYRAALAYTDTGRVTENGITVLIADLLMLADEYGDAGDVHLAAWQIYTNEAGA